MRDNYQKKLRKHLILLGDTTGLKELLLNQDRENPRHDENREREELL